MILMDKWSSPVYLQLVQNDLESLPGLLPAGDDLLRRQSEVVALVPQLDQVGESGA